MGGMFSKPKKVKPPPPPPPPEPIPEALSETEEEEIKKVRRRKGYAKTIITGALEPPAKKRTVLG